jgi:hypothetical protein
LSTVVAGHTPIHTCLALGSNECPAVHPFGRTEEKEPGI